MVTQRAKEATNVSSCWLCLFVFMTGCGSCDRGTKVDVGRQDIGNIYDLDLVDHKDSSNDSNGSVKPDLDQTQDIDAGHNAPHLWKNVTNRCAPNSGGFPALPSSSGMDVPPKPLEVSIAWQTKILCPTDSGLFGDDIEQTFATLAMGNKDGVMSAALALERPSSPVYPGFGVKAVAWLNPKDGTSLGCDLVPDGRGVAASPMFISPWGEEQPLLATVTYQDDLTSEFTSRVPPIVGWWSSQETGALEIPEEFDTPTPRAKLLPDGQLLIYPRPDRIVSVDARTNKLNWVVRPSDIRTALNKPYSGAIKMDPSTTSFDLETRKIRTRILAADGRIITENLDIIIDSCGAVSSPQVKDEGLKRTIRLGSRELKVSDLGSLKISATLDLPNGPVHLDACDDLVSLNPSSVACIKIGRPTNSLEVHILLENGATQIVKLDAADEAELVQFAWFGVALKNDILLLQAELADFENNNTKIYRRLFFVDWRNSKVLKTLDIPIPKDAQVSSPQSPPVVDNNGKIVFEFSGYVFGVATNSSGLSNTAFPRGWRLGRNNNAGTP